MEENRHRITCANHPDVEAVEKCADCGKFYCRDCVMKIEGKYRCTKCHDILAKLTDTLGFVEKYNLRKFRYAMGGCFVIFLGGLIAIMLLLVMPYIQYHGAMRCQDRLRQVYRAMHAYAGDHDDLFPAENNNLIPLYTPKYSEGVDLLKALRCPGTKSVVEIPEHLKDDSDATIGTGMSYFYQGGLSRTTDKDEQVRMLWDQARQNHKGKGINILHTNGTVKFWEEDPPELKKN